MAQLVRRERTSAWQSETFAAGSTAQNEARAPFQEDVEQAGNRWPDGWTPGAGYHRPTPEPDPEPEPGAAPPMTMAELAADYLDPPAPGPDSPQQAQADRGAAPGVDLAQPPGERAPR